jgi:hypothetical protein
MPNAWFYYIFPLMLSAVFVIAGVRMLRRTIRLNQDRESDASKPAPGCFAVLILLVGSAVGLAILLASPTPWARQELFDHIFRTPPDKIDRFVIKAGKPEVRYSLTKKEVVIDDPTRIREIAATLSAGREIWPNHPRTKWHTRMEMVTHDGSYYFSVSSTEAGDRNGILVDVTSRPEGGGWNLGAVRADGLERILENAVNAAATH